MACHDPPSPHDSGWQRQAKEKYNPNITRQSLTAEARKQRKAHNVGVLPLQLPVRLPSNRPKPVCAWLRGSDLPILLVEQPCNGTVKAYVQGQLKQLDWAAVTTEPPVVEPAKPKPRRLGSEAYGDRERLLWLEAKDSELEDLAAWCAQQDVKIPLAGKERLATAGLATREIQREADLNMRLQQTRLEAKQAAMAKARAAAEARLNDKIDELLEIVWSRLRQRSRAEARAARRQQQQLLVAA